MGTERKGKERKGKERKGTERKGRGGGIPGTMRFHFVDSESPGSHPLRELRYAPSSDCVLSPHATKVMGVVLCSSLSGAFYHRNDLTHMEELGLEVVLTD